MIGPNSPPDRAGAEPLDREEPDQDRHSVIGTTSGQEEARRDLESPRPRREHRDRRRDHAVAVEQRRAEDAERDQRRHAWRRRCLRRSISATSAMMPPSPWLSARMMNATYLSETMIVSAQKISESDAVDAGRRRHARRPVGVKILHAYSGLVPMSP